MNVLNSLLTKISRMLTCTQMRAFLPVRKVPRILPFGKNYSADPKLPKDDFPPGHDDLSKNSVPDLNVSRTQMDTIRMFTCFNNNWALPHLFSPKYLPAISGIYGHLNSTQLLQVRGFSLWKRVHDSLGGNKAQAKVNPSDRDYGNTPSILPDECGLPGKPQTESSNIPDNAKANLTSQEDRPTILTQPEAVSAELTRGEDTSIPSEKILDHVTSTQESAAIVSDPRELDATSLKVPLPKKVSRQWQCPRCSHWNPKGHKRYCGKCKASKHRGDTQKNSNNLTTVEGDQGSATFSDGKARSFEKDQDLSNTRSPPKQMLPLVSQLPSNELSEGSVSVAVPQGSTTWLCNCCKRSNPTHEKRCGYSTCHAPRGQDPNQNWTCACKTINLAGNWRCTTCKKLIPTQVPQVSTWLCNCCKRPNRTDQPRCVYPNCHAPRGQDPNQSWTCQCKTTNLAGSWRCTNCKKLIPMPGKNRNSRTRVEGDQGSATFSDSKARSLEKDQHLPNPRALPKQMLPLVSQLPSTKLSEGSVSITEVSKTWLCACCKRFTNQGHWRCKYEGCYAPKGQDPNQNWTCACKTTNLAGNWRCTTCKTLIPTRVQAQFSTKPTVNPSSSPTIMPSLQQTGLPTQKATDATPEGSSTWLCKCCMTSTNHHKMARCGKTSCHAPKGQDPNENWTCECGTTNLAGNWRCKTCRKLKPVGAVSRTWLCKCCLQYNIPNHSRCGRTDCHAPRGQDPNQNWTCACGTTNLAGNWRCKACDKLIPIPELPGWACEKCNTRNPENFTKYCSKCRTPKNIDGCSESQIRKNALACTFCSTPLEPSSSECNTCKAPTFWQCKICGSDNKENYKNPHQSCPNCDTPKSQSTHFWCESCKKFNPSYSPQCVHKDCNAPNGGTDTKPLSAKVQEVTASSNFDLIMLRQTEKNKTGGTDNTPLGTKEPSASSNLNTIMLHQTEKSTPVEDVPEKTMSSLFNEIMNDPLKDFFGDRKFGPRAQTTGQQTSLDKLQLAERQAAIAAKEDHLEQKYGPAYQRKTPKIIQKPAVPVVPTLQIPPYPITLKELAHLCGKKVSLVLACTKRLGESDLSEASMLEPDLSEIIGLDYGFNVERLSQREFVRQSKGDKSAQQYPGRPPVICVMGHVDHGKTTLLDFLRKSNVAAQEDGGITQRLAAFTVTDTLGKGGQVTFLDTPGHAAFTKMRNSGAQVTDIVCLVIAADDGVSAQTKEVLKLVESFKLSLVVALSKIDRPGIDIEEAKERIQNQLLEHGIVCESYKGDVPVVPVSGITGQGIPELTEILALQSEVLDLRANPEGKAEALVLDATVDQKRGPIIDVVVTWGSLRPRDVVVVGTQSGAIRTLLGSDGKELQVAGPSTPARIIGLKNVPDAGEELIAVASEAEAQLRIKAVEARKPQMQNQDSTQGFAPEVQKQSRTSNSQTGEEASTGEAPRTVPIVVKADADGVLDALCQAVQGIKDEAIDIHIVYKGVGPVSKGDIDRLTVGGDKATIFCFNVKPDTPATKTLAQKEGIDIRRHTVIYHLIDDIKKYVSQFLPEQIVEEKLGSAEILQVFEMTGAKEGTVVAGCRIMDGKITAVDHYRIMRKGTELHSSQGLSSLKINNKTVDEVSKGMECGMLFDGFTDFKAGDEIEFFKTESRKRTLL